MVKTVDGTRNWIHDCGCCTFLGPYKGMDLYACIKTEIDQTELIARFSDEGGDYKSLPLEMVKKLISKGMRDEYLEETFRRFQEYMAYKFKR